MSRGIGKCRGDARSWKMADGLLEGNGRGRIGRGGRRYGFEDSGAGADDICTTEFFRSNVEHAL